MGLGTDGASNVASNLNGLNGLWKEQNPYTVHVHCVCHRLALAVSQAGSDLHLVKSAQAIVREVYTLVHNHPKVLKR